MLSRSLGHEQNTPTYMESTIRYGGLPMWGFPKWNRSILQRFMNYAAKKLILILLQVKNIWSMMGIIIALSIRIISYCYWVILDRRSYGCAQKHLYDKISCSKDLWGRILILQHIWRALSVIWNSSCRISKAQQKHSTAVLPMNSIKLNIGDVASSDYTIYDGGYYSIFDKYNITS